MEEVLTESRERLTTEDEGRLIDSKINSAELEGNQVMSVGRLTESEGLLTNGNRRWIHGEGMSNKRRLLSAPAAGSSGCMGEVQKE